MTAILFIRNIQNIIKMSSIKLTFMSKATVSVKVEVTKVIKIHATLGATQTFCIQIVIQHKVFDN